ncbi:Crp/Fnr family transcriptional regulator [Flavobacterium cheongpyeongense]|jgi:CRP/FNR family transcriptional regulator, anaerobic regulatory protein|uniref:Crp/Fnr family transcriptional regulator n=1 Tax=Flavobacterium cheongpyeongense TaxID=2212651 RepID=A0A2V4BPN9_9FLAO|nr:Crp/Fnr family transcriptional regulator [Flavobacterium cheongpyeongense]PXY40978.1 Crp/Fnr family transcriptional regulator [Flavobacterium cheongpyeongense]
MINNISAIRQLILSYIEIDDSEWQYCTTLFNIEQIKKRNFLLEQGKVCRNVSYVVSGLLRIYFVDYNGEEKTFHFSLENTFATDYESFLKGIPCNFSIQAMEDTIVITITLEKLQNFYKNVRYGEKLGRLVAEDYFFIVNDKIKAIYTQSPMERYQVMNAKFPKILQRVPQRYIASYLNISSVHLSRLKNSATEDEM